MLIFLAPVLMKGNGKGSTGTLACARFAIGAAPAVSAGMLQNHTATSGCATRALTHCHIHYGHVNMTIGMEKTP
jgi:hypothetical protein